MNVVYFNDEVFKNSTLYNEFINNNQGSGLLNIRAYAANEALPISNMKIIVSHLIGNTKIIFYEGITDSSGIINKIILPAPNIILNDNEIPESTDYNIEAIYNNVNLVYLIKMYNGIQVIQNINIVPETQTLKGDYYVS